MEQCSTELEQNSPQLKEKDDKTENVQNIDCLCI